MIGFIARRLVFGAFTCFLISVIAFGIIVLPPGDFATSYTDQFAQQMNMHRNSEQARAIEEKMRQQYNIDRPLYVQYTKWAWDMLHGDLGVSMVQNKPVWECISERLLMTLVLTGTTILFTWVLAIPIGIYSAVRQYSPGDYIFTIIGFLGLAVPDFLLALALLWVMYDRFDVLLDGLFSSRYTEAPWSVARVWDLIKHLWIPALVLGTAGTCGLIRIVRANLLDELQKAYVVTARAKGMTEWKLVLKYPLRVALNPFLSGIGYVLPALFSGSVIVSVVLNLPTLGPVLLDSLLSQDVYMAASAMLLLGVLTIVGILLSDILLAIADPRIRIQ